MLPGAYVFRMRSLWTANSLTSRNISSAPPARTLMLYHYSVTPTPSQGITPPSVLFLHPLGHRSPSGIASLALSFLKTGPCAFLHPLLRALPDHRIRLLSERQLQFTLDVDSSSATGPFFLSIVLFEQNRLEEAEQRAREALLRNPGLAL